MDILAAPLSKPQSLFSVETKESQGGGLVLRQKEITHAVFQLSKLYL